MVHAIFRRQVRDGFGRQRFSGVDEAEHQVGECERFRQLPVHGEELPR